MGSTLNSEALHQNARPKPPNPTVTLESNADHYSKASDQRYECRAQLLNVLQVVQATACSLCWFFGDQKHPPGSHDSAFHCPRNVLNTTQYGNFKAKLKFTKPSLGGYYLCHTCCTPHQPPFDHPPNSQRCTQPDIIKPIAYAIFSCGELRSRVFSQLGLQANHFDSVESYSSWLGQCTPGTLYNIHKVVLAYYKLHPCGGIGHRDI
jgi:hypothetical protein